MADATRRLPRTNIKLHQQNGPVVRIAPKYFSISDPSAVEAVYGHGTKFIKSEWYEAWNVTPDPAQTNLFSERVSQRHAENRREVASMYSMSSLVAYETYVDNCIAVFKQRLDGISAQGRTVNMVHWLQCYAFDVIGEITFGSRFGFLDAGNDVGGVMKSIEDGLAASSYLGLYPWIYPFYLRILGYLRQGLSYVNEFSLRHIQETRAAMKGSRKDLPSISDWDILAIVGANVGAGSDTTAISLSSSLYHLYRQPRCLAKLREEIESAGIGAEIPAFKSTQAMPYLQAVLKEALRVHPGTRFPLFRVVPKGGHVLAGQFFPGGVNVGINSWVLHYDTNIYGADASIFRPERWLEADEQQLKTMEQNYMPFGIGSRTCLGKNISLLEMGMLVPVLVRDYDFDIQGERDLEARNRWFVKPVDFWVRVTRR
ncbi:cytochrome P450 [Aspergillus foveolatus]|uniref:cytochrome P450 n=1 Tax=Aspergillus foveolatus TaxID=210207 RepID=UPI003CCDFD78